MLTPGHSASLNAWASSFPIYIASLRRADFPPKEVRQSQHTGQALVSNPTLCTWPVGSQTFA